MGGMVQSQEDGLQCRMQSEHTASNTEIYRSEKSNFLKGIKQCTWRRAHLKLKDGYEALKWRWR